MKNTLELGDLIKISYNDSMNEQSYYCFVVIEELKTADSWLYLGNVLIPRVKKNRLCSFFEFQVKNNFGPITEKELIENYPEHLI